MAFLKAAETGDGKQCRSLPELVSCEFRRFDRMESAEMKEKTEIWNELANATEKDARVLRQGHSQS